jgi:hypothetical protein
MTCSLTTTSAIVPEASSVAPDVPRAPSAESAKAQALTTLRTIFALDLRSLAVFRVGLALIVLMDLFWRSRWLAAHYSDEGVLPRRALFAIYDRPWDLSLHALSGAWQVEAALFAVAGIVAAAMLVGFRTRLATAITWGLLISLQSRNPLVLQGGDVLLRCLLFWAMFLPLGACWSIDRARAREEPLASRSVLSVGGAALILQIALVYIYGGFRKSSPVWTTDGTAVAYALSLAPFSTTLGTWLLGFPALLKAMTFATLYLERFAPFLLLMPIGGGWLRLAVVAMFIGFHLGLALTMHLGPFPWVCIAAWLALVPTTAWDFAARRWSGAAHARIGMVRERVGALAQRVAPALAARVSTPEARASAATLRSPVLPYHLGSVIAGLFMALMALWLLRNVEPRIGTKLLPHALDPIARLTRLDQHWNMFAPAPTTRDGWYAIPATLRGGGEVDLLTGGAPMTSRADAAVLPMAQNERWRKYLSNLRNGNVHARTWFAQYLLREWNGAHRDQPAQQATKVQICFYGQPTLATGTDQVKKVTLWTYNAPEPAKPRAVAPSSTPAARPDAHDEHRVADQPPAVHAPDPPEVPDEPEAQASRAEGDEEPQVPGSAP